MLKTFGSVTWDDDITDLNNSKKEVEIKSLEKALKNRSNIFLHSFFQHSLFLQALQLIKKA